MTISFALFVLYLALACSLPITEIKPLPSPLILAPGERVRFETKDYFSGYNLTFFGMYGPQKISTVTSSPLNISSDIISTRISDTEESSIIAILLDDPAVNIIEYAEETLSLRASIPISDAGKCFDLEFLNQDTIVVDCNMKDGTKAFSFISVKNSKIFKVTEIEEKFRKHASRQLRPSYGFKGADLVTLISSSDTKEKLMWQIILTSFTKKYDIDSMIKLTSDDLNLSEDLYLNDIMPLSPTGMLLGLNDTLYWASVDENNSDKEFAVYPLRDNIDSFSAPYVSDPLSSLLVNSKSMAYEVLRSEGKGFLEVADIFIDTIYSAKEKNSTKETPIEHSVLTKDFALLVTGGSKPTLSIYQRGDSKNSEIFYFNYITPQTFPYGKPEKVIASPENNLVFWITSKTIYAFLIQEIWVDVTNNKPGTVRDYSIQICSERECLDKEVQLQLLTEDDYSLYKFGADKMKYIKSWDAPLDIVVDDLFAGPHLQYKIVTEDGEILDSTYYRHVELSLGKNLTLAFLSLHYDNIYNYFRLYYQQPNSNSLDFYLCHLATKTENPPLNCDKKSSAKVTGKVSKVYSNNPEYDIIESIDESGKIIAYKASKKLSSALQTIEPSADGCRAIYQSFDNILESNFFCAKDDDITIVKNLTSLSSDHIKLNVDYEVKKILTHPAFPGLLFISNSSYINIIWSEFYLGPHYNADNATLNTLFIGSKGFDFIVTSSHLVVFMPENNTVSEFDISNPVDIMFNKVYMLYETVLPKNGNLLISYSLATEFIYFLGQSSKGNDYAIIVLEPNGFGHSNFKYIFYAGTSDDPSSFTLSVDSYTPDSDFVLYGTQENIEAVLIPKHAKITIQGNNISDKNLFSEKNLHIIAKQDITDTDAKISAQLLIINTQRSVSALPGTQNLVMNLNFNNDTKIQFKEGDFFEGPAFRMTLQKEYENDNIFFNPRVRPNQSGNQDYIPMSISDVAVDDDKEFVVIIEDGYPVILLYNASTFPDKSSKLRFIYVHGLQTEGDGHQCYQIEIDKDKDFIGALCYDFVTGGSYIDIISLNDENLHTQLVTPSEHRDARYKIVSNYLFYTSRTGYYAVYIYKITKYEINKDKSNINIALLKTLTRDDLNIAKKDNITDIDGFKFGTNQAGVFLVTGSTGFNYILVQNDEVKISSYPDFANLFSDEFLDTFNRKPIFNALSLLRGPTFHMQTGDTEYLLILSSQNAFAYLLSVTVSSQGDVTNVKVIEGYIQYQNYQWLEKVTADENIIVLMGQTSEQGQIMNHYFFYDRQGLTNLGTSYKLYDAFQVLTLQKRINEKPILFLLMNQYKRSVFFRQPVTAVTEKSGLVQYSVNEQFSLETTASRVSSGYVNLIAGNDRWSATIKVPVNNYSNVLPGVEPGIIILFVFGGIGLSFILIVVCTRVFANKGKRGLKDTEFGEQATEAGESSSIESDPSQYFKIE